MILLNPNLKYNIGINGAIKALKASAWCNKNVPEKDWHICMQSIGVDNYTFQFDKQEQASTFALRWV